METPFIEQLRKAATEIGAQEAQKRLDASETSEKTCGDCTDNPLDDITYDCGYDCENGQTGAEQEVIYSAEYNFFTHLNKNFISLEVPGYSKETIDAYIQDDVLVIEGTREIKFNPDEVNVILSNFIIPNEFVNKFAIRRDEFVKDITVKDGICLIEIGQEEAEKEMLIIN